MDLSVNDLIERIKTIVPLKELEKIGLNQNTINNWKYRNTFPKINELYKIAEFLNVSADWLVTGKINIENIVLTEDEVELIDNFRKLKPDVKAMLKIQVSALTTL